MEYRPHNIFRMMMPVGCSNVPSELLSPRHAWSNEEEYDRKAKELARMFVKNFEKYSDSVSDEILSAAPSI